MSFRESIAETPPAFRSKVIIRNLRLFDTTSSSNVDGDSSVDRKSEAEEEFKSSIQDWMADIEHFQYYHCTPTSQQPLSLPWATVQFKTRKALISFKNSYSLSNSIEFSIVQPISSSNAVVDPIANTIEEDQDFIDFVNGLKLCEEGDADDGSVIGNETPAAATTKVDDNGSALYEKMMKEKQVRKEKEVFHRNCNNGGASSSTKNNSNTTNANLNNNNNINSNNNNNNNNNNKNKNKNKNKSKNKNKKKPEKEEREDEVKINVHQSTKSKFTIAKRDSAKELALKETTAKETTMKEISVKKTEVIGDSATKQKAKKEKKEKPKKPKVKKDLKKMEILIKAKPDDKSVLGPQVQIKPQIKPKPTPVPTSVATPQETKPKIYTRASKTFNNK